MNKTLSWLAVGLLAYLAYQKHAECSCQNQGDGTYPLYSDACHTPQNSMLTTATAPGWIGQLNNVVNG